MQTTDVLIVGAGPTGMMAALLLQRLGISTCVVERRSDTQSAPAAHAINARTFEICRQAGVDMAAIADACQSPADAGAAHWVTRLGGEVLGSLTYERQGDDVLAVTPTPLRNLSQHRFEPILHHALRQSGAPALRYGQRWLSATQDADGVTSSISEVGSERTYQVRSRYLLAADGAGSPLRKSLGITQTGPERIQCFIMIHFAANLRQLVGDHPGVLFWVTDPEVSGAFVAHDLDREWVFMHAYEPEREPASGYDRARCEAIVRRAMVDADVEFEVRTISPWVMTCQVADRYRDGRIFLVGDAAHRFPPTGGLGLNTGVQDAHNLAWKLAMVLQGTAPATLLDTYEVERRPVAQYNAEQSLNNAFRLIEVPMALGATDDPETTRRNYTAALADPAKRAQVSQAIANQAEHFDMLGLQLGYRYTNGALLGDVSQPPATNNPVREFVPTTTPGARLPHGWLDERSTLDLIRPDRFTLLVGPAGQAWKEAAASAAVGLDCIALGEDVPDPNEWWTTVAGMSPTGALLVRPDQHIALRVEAIGDTPEHLLREALAQILSS